MSAANAEKKEKENHLCECNWPNTTNSLNLNSEHKVRWNHTTFNTSVICSQAFEEKKSIYYIINLSQVLKEEVPEDPNTT